jgi:hypothetical protein
MHPGLMAEQIEIRDWYVMYVLLVHTKIERPAMLLSNRNLLPQ